MTNHRTKRLNYFLIPCAMLALFTTAGAQGKKKKKLDTAPAAAAAQSESVAEPKVIGKEIHFADGSVIKADDVWKQGNEFWYRIGGTTQRVARSVKSVEVIHAPVEKSADATADATKADAAKPATPESFWILLKGGARLKVDEVTESDDGAWCRRGNYSVLIASDRIDRIERESDIPSQTQGQRDWTTGNAKLDQQIRSSGSRFGVDPYLVFCVMEHESQFRARAISPKGAQGLMQLMPGTAARFGVSNPFDPGQNISAGTQYLKELLTMFGGRIDLALASYNAGEGAVLKYGSNIPPYRETREYVQRISRRYGVAPRENRRPASPSN
jgi:hypothetical protein